MDVFGFPYDITIDIAAASKDMTVLAAVKTELGITGTADDAWLALVIQEESAAACSYCNREFARETVTESFRLEGEDRCVTGLYLSRTPVASITSVVEDGVTLTAADYELAAADGRLYRLDGAGNRSAWARAKIAVTYAGGYIMLSTLPQDLERAVRTMVKHRWYARQRDPLVKAASLDGVMSEQYWVGDVNSDGTPAEVTAVLDRYRRIAV